MEGKIFAVIVPTEKKIKVKGGKRVEEEEKIYPGYVLVDMIVTDDSWYVVRNTPRVTGFVGAGVSPVPLDPKEVDSLFARMSKGETEHAIDLSQGIWSRSPTVRSRTSRAKWRSRHPARQDQGPRLHVRPRDPRRARFLAS
jgi:transcription antitermination factor NusG